MNVRTCHNQTTLTLQIASDIHLECRHDIFKIVPCAPVLALLGDIGYACEWEGEGKKLADFLAIQSAQFEYVLYLPGNHGEAHHNIK